VFRYELVGTPLVDSMVHLLGTSALGFTIIGPRYGGKRYLLNNLAERLKSLSRDCLLLTFEDYVGQEAEPWTDFLSPLESQGSATAPRVLLAADIDNLRLKTWHRFLSATQPHLATAKLQVVLTGGSVLVDRQQTNLELSKLDGYVVQGLDLDEFKQLASRWAAIEQVAFEDMERQVYGLWQQTGGSGALLGALFYLITEKRLSGGDLSATVDGSTVGQLLDQLVQRGVRWAPIFGRAAYAIRRDPSIWDSILSLLQFGRVVAPDPNGAPTSLELSGLGKRQGNKVDFASEAMRVFARAYFDYHRLGDLWASQGNWEKAFDCFSREALPPNYFDRSEPRGTVASICETLLYESSKGIAAVHDRFVDICRDFFRLSLWRLTWNGEQWEVTASHTTEDLQMAWMDRLPSGNQLQSGETIMPFDGPGDGVGIVVGDLRPGWRNAYLLRDISGEGLTGARIDLLTRLLASFSTAQNNAIEHEEAKVRQRDMEVQRDCLAELFRMIGSGASSYKLCELAANRLRKCGYRRVLISLVDPERKRIRGVYDSSPDTGVDVAADTDYALDDPKHDIQPYVVVNNEAKVVIDALTEPLANQALVRRAGMRSFAILPIPSLFNPSQATGTIHVERLDLGYPTDAELSDLRTFAVGVSGALSLAEQNEHWSELLDRFPDPLFYERIGRKVVGNRAAGHPRWENGRVVPLEISSALQEARFQRNTTFAAGSGSDSLGTAVIVADRLTDARGNTFGWYAFVRQFQSVSRILDVYTHIATASSLSSAIKVLFQEFQRQGFESGRLYLIEEHDPDSFVLKDCFYAKALDREAVMSKRSRMAWPKRTDAEPNLPWRSIAVKEPMIFQFRPAEPHGVVYSPDGFRVTVDPSPAHLDILEKRSGAYWIDFPLLGLEGPIGKITLEGPLPSAEDYQLYRLLTRVFADLFTAFLGRERESRFVLRERAEQLMGETLHNIKARFAPLSEAVSRYRLLEHRVPELRETNQRIRRTLGSIATLTDRAGRAVSRLTLNTKSLNVAAVVAALASDRSDCVIQISPQNGEILLEGDRTHLEGMFTELINNSVEAYQSARENGCPTIKIMFTLLNSRRGAVIEVQYSDDGPGVSEEKRPFIFEPWASFQLRPVSGRGLGLSYVRRVVLAHGGDIEVGGEVGEGAVFIIKLPVEQSATMSEYVRI